MSSAGRKGPTHAPKKRRPLAGEVGLQRRRSTAAVEIQRRKKQRRQERKRPSITSPGMERSEIVARRMSILDSSAAGPWAAGP